jgi:hypothetical protein
MPCIDPGSRPHATTRLHYNKCVQSASLLGAELISLGVHKMYEVTAENMQSSILSLYE